MKKSLTENFTFCGANQWTGFYMIKRVERVNSSACLRRQFPKYGRPITKSFLGTVLTIVFGARILSEII